MFLRARRELGDSEHEVLHRMHHAENGGHVVNP
jgi:hypothetical protein